MQTIPAGNTDYTRGFRAGLNKARADILEYIGIHAEQNVTITSEDIAEEIIHMDNQDIAYNLKATNDYWDDRHRP